MLYTRSKKIIARKYTYNKKKRLSGAAARTGNLRKNRIRDNLYKERYLHG